MRAARFSLFDRNRPSDQLVWNWRTRLPRRVSFFFGNEFSQIAASLEAACEVKTAKPRLVDRRARHRHEILYRGANGAAAKR